MYSFVSLKKYIQSGADMSKKIWLLISVMLFLIPFATATTYRIETDSDYGFYRVRDIDTHATPDFKNHILTINLSNVVEWENYANPDERLTIVSDIGLWNSSNAVMRWNYQTFSYTFNDSGNFSVHLKEYPRFKMNIVVIENRVVVPTITHPNAPIQVDENESRSVVAPRPTPSLRSNVVSFLTGFFVVVIIGGILILLVLREK